MPQPIGVFGGIFDPVHNGHLASAFLAYEYFDCKTLLFVPAGIPPHKLTTVVAPSHHRLAMLKIALKGEPAARIWENEIVCSSVSYTIDTIDELEKHFPLHPIYFIIGSDNLTEIPTWHEYRQLLKKVTLCVAARPSFKKEIPDALSPAKIEYFPSPEWNLSSTVLRSYLAGGYSCKYLLPDGVSEYIIENDIYRKSNNDTISVIKADYSENRP